MASPGVSSTTNSGQATNQTSLSVSVPASAVGERMICILLTGGGGSGGAAPTNWTLISNSSNLAFYETLVRTAAGSGTVTFTQLTTGWWCSQVYLITASSITDAFQIGGGATGTSANPNAGSFSPTGGAADWLWIATTNYGHSFGTNQTTSGYPASYTSTTDSDPGGSFGQVRIATAWRQLNAATEDPGQFTLTGSLGWGAATLAVPPRAPVQHFMDPHTQAQSALAGY